MTQHRHWLFTKNLSWKCTRYWSLNIWWKVKMSRANKSEFLKGSRKSYAFQIVCISFSWILRCQFHSSHTSKLANPKFILQNPSRKTPQHFVGFGKKIHADLMHNEATKTADNINSNLGWPSLFIAMELLHRKKQELIRKDNYLK